MLGNRTKTVGWRKCEIGGYISCTGFERYRRTGLVEMPSWGVTSVISGLSDIAEVGLTGRKIDWNA